MSTSFPEGFRCDAELKAAYPAAEREMLPAINWKAARLRRMAPYIEFDDAVQEGRLALLRALMNFDSGYPDASLKKYVSKTLDNCYKDMFYRAVAQMRMPRVPVRGVDGEWNLRAVVPASLDSMMDTDCGYIYEPATSEPDPEDILRSSQLDSEARRFKMKLLNMLAPKDKEVFQAKFNPPIELLIMCENLDIEIRKSIADGEHDADQFDIEIPNEAIEAYLDVTKNQVDWSMFKIKDAFSQLVKDIDFSDLFGDIVGSKGWPMIHMNEAPTYNKSFVDATRERRDLGPTPSEPPDIREATGCLRQFTPYPWGGVMYIHMDGEHRTVVIEGDRININTGGVFSESKGVQEELSNYVPWYRKLVKRLKEAGNG